MNALTLIKLMLFIVISLALLFISSYILFYLFPIPVINAGGSDVLRVVYSIGLNMLFMIVATVVFGYIATLISPLNPIGEKAKPILLPLILFPIAYTFYHAYLLTYAFGYYLDWIFYLSVACLILAFSFVTFKIYQMLIRDRYA
jgi:hypothetical protein